MTETSPQAKQLSQALHDGLERYVEARREKIPYVVENVFSLRGCLRLAMRRVFHDLACNPVNTLWAIPYLTIRKFLEIFEKIGLEFPKVLLPAIPRSARTAFQKKVEGALQTELFGLPADKSHKSELAWALESNEEYRALYGTPEWQKLVRKADADVRQMVTEYCNTQNGFTDLAASGACLLAAQTLFGNRNLDVFEMGRRWAYLSAHQDAVNRFFLGRKVGKLFYRVVHAPPPTTKEVYIATAIALAILAVFSTMVNVLSYPMQGMFGIQERQLGKLVQSVEDKLLLGLTKGARAIAN